MKSVKAACLLLPEQKHWTRIIGVKMREQFSHSERKDVFQLEMYYVSHTGH